MGASVARSARRRVAVGVALGLAAATLVVFAVGNAAILLAGEGRIHASPSEVPPRTWAIVPGARVRTDGSPSAALADRLTTALEAFQAGRVERILVSGDARTRDEAGTMARWLSAQGVPADRIARDHSGLRTRDTMVRAAREEGVRSAVVCTQRFHLPRALAWAIHSGIDAVGLAADRRDYPHQLFDELRESLARVLAWLEMLVR